VSSTVQYVIIASKYGTSLNVKDTFDVPKVAILYLEVSLCTEEEEPGELAVSAVNDGGGPDSGAGGGDIEFKMTHEEVKEGNGRIDEVI
jgi:hypothetical protein